MPVVSIAGLDKANVLAALYNASRPLGMGFMHYNPSPMTCEEAQAILDGGTTYFDYLNGRVMKLDLGSDSEIDPWLYDRDNGQGAAERAIEALRRQGPDASDIAAAHASGTLAAAETAKSLMGKESRLDGGTLTIGLADVKHALSPRVEEAVAKNRGA